MIFIPPQATTQQVTRHSRELGKQVEQLVREYRRSNPDLTDEEINAALTQSMGEQDSHDDALRRRKLAALAAVVAVGIGAAFAGMARGGGTATPGLLWKVVGGTVAAAAIVVAVLRLQKQD